MWRCDQTSLLRRGAHTSCLPTEQVAVYAARPVHPEAYLAERPERAGGLEPGTAYVVVDGHRRLAAARLLEWDSIRVMVDDAQVVSDDRLLEAAFIANTQRDDMSDLEQAAALQKLVAFHGSQSKTARRLGISQAVIPQRLSLLSLSSGLQADLNTGARKVGHVRGLSLSFNSRGPAPVSVAWSGTFAGDRKLRTP